MTPGLRRWAAVAGGVAVLALDVHLISPYVSRAADALQRPVLGWVAIAFVAETVSLLASAHLQRRMLLTTGTRVRMPTAVGVTFSAYALNMSLPAGPAVSAGYTFRRLRQLGASIPTAGFTMISSSVLSMLAYGLLAVTGFAVAGGSSGGPVAVFVGVLAAGLLVLLTRMVLTRPDILERLGLRALHGMNRVRHRDPDAGAPDLRRSTSLLASIHPRGRDWATGLLAALSNWVADLLCLYAACRAVGADDASIGVVLLAYLSGMSVSGISLVPAGLGVVDAAVILVLAQNGVGAGLATAAMVLYRVFSFGLPAIVGWIAWIAHARAGRRCATSPSIRRKHDDDDPPATASDPVRSVAAPQDVRLPGRARAVADRGRHATGARCRRRPPAVRRRRDRSGSGLLSDGGSAARRHPSPTAGRRSG